MNTPTRGAPRADDLCLAQLACLKLSGLVQGALSIGLPALVTGAPEPAGFFDKQFRVMTSFAVVLHTVAGGIGGQQEALRLRERSRAVLAALEDLERALRDRGPRPWQVARQSAFALCDRIGDFAELVELDRSRISKMKDVVAQVFDAVEAMAQTESAPVG